MECDYCQETDQVMVFIDMSGSDEDIHICRRCYESGVEPCLND